MFRAILILITILLFFAPAAGQSINISFGTGFGPSSDYGAAGEAGFWNHITGEQSVTFSLFGLDGAPAGVTVSNFGGTELLSENHPGTTGNDQLLLDQFLVTYTPNLETCLFFNGLEPGTYRVTTYAWLPSLPLERSWVTVDDATQGGIPVGRTVT